MRFSALALSTLAAQATARAVGANIPRGVDYSNIDYSNVDWSRIDWSKVDFGFGGHHGGNDDNNDAPAPAPAAPAPAPQPEQVERPNPQPTVVVVESEPEPEVEAPAPEAPAPVATQVAEVQQEEPEQEEETAPSSGSGGMSADQKAALDAHNAARSAVGNSALSWDASLAADAQSWANTIAAKGQGLEHASGTGQGENLYMQTGSSAPYENGINAFLSEKSLYNGEKIDSSNYMSFGHYTQAIWKSTTKVGMALAEAADGATYVVYRYSPPGNYMGELPF